MKGELIIEKATLKDMDDIAEIISSSATWYEPFLDEEDMKEHKVGENWIKENYQKRDFYLGSDVKGNKIGTISMQFFGNETYLGYIYLNAKHTGKGYGKKLMEFAKRKAIAKEQESMILIAHPEATWATKAYKRFGFELKHRNRNDILNYKKGLLKPYYEEGFHLYQYKLQA
jgi:RimJ/RimL family protein N-acetyltransferase